MSNINLIFFNLSKELQVISELSEYYDKKSDYDVEFINNPAEAGQFIQTSGNGIVLFKVANKADLQVAVDFLKNQKKLIKNGLVKPACLMLVKNKKVEKVLAKYGCQELLDDSMRSKTLSFKVDFWARNLRSQISKIEKQKEQKLKSMSQGKAQDAKGDEKKSDFAATKALELQSDTWILKHKSDHKKILKRYLIRLLGPSPHIGQWFELEPQPGDSMPTWKYVLKNQDEQQFILEDGAWYFSGSKPEFDWKAQRWNFSSDAPHLYFYTSDGQVFSRFKFSNGVVEVAENSNYALTKEELILETCDTKFNFDADKKEKEDADKFDKDADGEGDVGGKLDGESEGEDARNDLLTGKNKDGSVDELDNLKGKVSNEDFDAAESKDKKNSDGFSEDDLGGSYSGKSKGVGDEEEVAAKKAHGSFEEVSPEKKQKRGDFEEDDLGGNYGGKGSTDEINDDPLSGKLKLNKELKNKEDKDPNSLEKEGDVGGHYGGKGSTDEINDDPLSGKLKPNQAKLKDAKEHEAIDEGDVGGHYGGKGSTDEINDDPLSGKLKPNQAKLKDAKEHEAIDEGDVGGHYGGKGSTDEINDDPLSGNLKPNETKAKENKKSSFDEDDLGGHYDSEASTDQLERAPLKGKLAAQKDPFSDEEDDHSDGLINAKKKKSISREARSPEEEKLRDSTETAPIRSSADDPVAGVNARDGITEAELNNPDFQAPTKSAEDLGIDEIDRDALDKLKKKQEALKKAGLSDEDLNIDELDRDGLDKLMQKRKKALEAAGLLEEGDDLEDLGRKEPRAIKAIKEKSPISNKREHDDLGVDELDRENLDKLKKKQEALKKAGLSDDDLNIDELDRDGLDKLIAKRKEALKAAGLLEEDDDVEDLAKPQPRAIKKAQDKIEAKKKERENLGVDELNRDGVDALTKSKTTQQIGADVDETESLSNSAKKAFIGEVKDIDDESEDNVDKKIDKSNTQIGNKADKQAKPEVDKTKKVGNVESKSGKDLYADADDEIGELVTKKKEVSLDDTQIGEEIEEDLSAKKTREMIEALESKSGNVTDLKNAIIDNGEAGEEAKKDLDPNQIIDNKDSEDLKEIFSQEIPVSTESGELNVIIESADENVSHVCKFEDFYTTEIVVIIEKGHLAQDKEYNVKVNLKYAGSKVSIEQSAKVLEIEDFEDGKVLVCLEFINEVNEEKYNTFSTLYQERQESISEFMNLARGYYLEDEG